MASPFEDDLDTLKVGQLRALARDNQVNLDGCVEKQDMIDRLKAEGITSSFGRHAPPSWDYDGTQANRGHANRPSPPPPPPPPVEEPEAEGARQFQEGLERIDKDYEMQKVFPVPSNAVSGVALGGTTIVGGVVTSGVALVTMPIAGASEQGFFGFFTGLAAGVMTTLMVIPVTIYQGGKQIVVGIINTPSTTYHTIICDHYDEVDEEWVPNQWDYNLERESERVLGGAGAAAAMASSGSRSVKDTAYYDLLKVDPSATEKQLSKAYKIQAIKCHPDKNLDDPDAAKKFQAMSDAYQILADPVQRAKYDKNGPPTEGDKPKTMDAKRFFTMMFGADIFEPYVGTLSVATMASLFEKDAQITSRDFPKMQRKREVQLAIALVARLQGYVDDNDSESWRDSMESESKHLADAPFGEEMVRHVGLIYSHCAARHEFSLTSTMGFAACAGSMHNLSMKCELSGNVSDSLNVLSEGQQNKTRHMSDEQKQELQNKTINAVLQTVAQVTLIDVEETVSAVCDRVLTDASVDNDTLRSRCEALEVLGSIFESARSMNTEEGVASDTNWAHRMQEASAAATD